MSTEDFIHATDSDGFSVVNHNELDYSSYRNFQKELDGRFKKLEQERSILERKENLQRWDSKLIEPWSLARLGDLKDRKVAETALGVMKAKGKGSFFIRGGKGSGKTFLALAIARKYIQLGWLTPSQVMHMSEAQFLALTRTGYRYNETMSELFSNKNKLFIIDNVDGNRTYTDVEQALWGMFFEHVSKNEVYFIFTSRFSARSFVDTLPESAQSKCSYLIDGRILTMSGVLTPPQLDDEFTEDEMKEVEELEKKGTIFDSFGK